MKGLNRIPFTQAAIAAGLLLASNSSRAADLESMEATLRTLQAQVAQLQAQLAEQKAAVAKVSQEHAGHDEHERGDWTKGIAISGVVEAEMVHTDNAGSTADTEDFNLATFELEIHSHLTEFAEAEVVLKYEDGSADDDQLSIDEAVLTFSPAFMGPVSFTIGKAGVPLAAFETLAASDPYTKDLGDLGGGEQGCRNRNHRPHVAPLRRCYADRSAKGRRHCPLSAIREAALSTDADRAHQPASRRQRNDCKVCRPSGWRH